MEVPIIISDENNKSEISSRKKLKNRLTTGTFALLIALLAVVSATYAWYVYNTGRHTTKVRMAAGAVGEVSEIAPEDISDGEDVGSQEAEEILNDGETSVEQPDSADASDTSNPQVEIVLPQKNVFIPVSEFLPVQEWKNCFRSFLMMRFILFISGTIQKCNIPFFLIRPWNRRMCAYIVLIQKKIK